MLTKTGLERVFVLSKLIIKQSADGSIILKVAKVTDKFLLGGTPEEIHTFISALKSGFVVGKFVFDSKVFFDGCEIEQLGNG